MAAMTKKAKTPPKGLSGIVESTLAEVEEFQPCRESVKELGGRIARIRLKASISCSQIPKFRSKK